MLFLYYYTPIGVVCQCFSNNLYAKKAKELNPLPFLKIIKNSAYQILNFITAIYIIKALS